ncbi:hypothetical protein OIO90_003173 [Microbotryomycetes sp. JL221]|nr:hypothetical protein OIO90_003173 [Microbotryomycetes sp. JL221]
MPLDSNLYTLSVQPRKGQGGVVELVEEPAKQARYVAYREADSLVLGDGWIQDMVYARLSVTGQKSRVIDLVDPEARIAMTNPGSFSWSWYLEWESVRYKWERNSSTLLGADRSFTLSVVSGAVSRTSNPQYVIDVIRIEPTPQDRKGLEVVALVSLLGFVDNLLGEDTATLPVVPFKKPFDDVKSSIDGGLPSTSEQKSSTTQHSPSTSPAPSKTTRSLSLNEIEITDVERRDEDLKHCLGLLKDENLLWILLVGKTQAIVPHVVALAERIKTQRYKTSGEELNQYIDDDPNSRKQKYEAPKSIRVYLSRIELADMLPNYNKQTKTQAPAIRPAINFDRPPPKHTGTSSQAANQTLTSDAKPEADQTGSRSSWFGWSRK